MNHRLLRLSIMDVRSFEGILKQLSKQGRVVLKSMEQYQFTLEQSIDMVANDKILAQKLQGQQNQIKQAMSVIYNTVFNVENMDIMELYEQQSEANKSQVERNDEDDNASDPLTAPKPTQDFKNNDNPAKEPEDNSNNDAESEDDEVEDSE